MSWGTLSVWFEKPVPHGVSHAPLD